MGRKKPRGLEVGEVIIEKGNVMEKRYEVMGEGSEQGVLRNLVALPVGDGERQGFQPGGA